MLRIHDLHVRYGSIAALRGIAAEASHAAELRLRLWGVGRDLDQRVVPDHPVPGQISLLCRLFPPGHNLA